MIIRGRFHSVISLVGDVIKSIIKLIFVWTIKLCRIVTGLVVIKTGFDFSRGSGAFAYREADVITGIFVILIGAYFILSSLFPDLFDKSDSGSH
jgi:hypothetical protein